MHKSRDLSQRKPFSWIVFLMENVHLGKEDKKPKGIAVFAPQREEDTCVPAEVRLVKFMSTSITARAERSHWTYFRLFHDCCCCHICGFIVCMPFSFSQ